MLLQTLLSILPAISARPLDKRIQPPGNLFGPGGKPAYRDIAQTTMDNCGWAATSAALAYVNPYFLTTIIHDNGDEQSATFDIWEFPSLTKKSQTVYKKNLPSNANNKGTEWWSGGIEQAAVQIGVSMYWINAGDAFGIQTGSNRGLDRDEMWAVFERAPTSPVLALTGKEGGVLVTEHYYTVLNATAQNGRRSLALYNPWGTEDVYDYNAIWPQLIQTYHLKHWETGPNKDESTAATPKVTSPPSDTASEQQVETQVVTAEPVRQANTSADDSAISQDADDEVVWVTMISNAAPSSFPTADRYVSQAPSQDDAPPGIDYSASSASAKSQQSAPVYWYQKGTWGSRWWAKWRRSRS